MSIEVEEIYHIASEKPLTEGQEEALMIVEVASDVLNSDMTLQSVFNTLLELYEKGKRIGWIDHKDLIRQLNEDN